MTSDTDSKPYKIYFPLAFGHTAVHGRPIPAPPSNHKRGVAGFTWSRVALAYHWRGSNIAWGHSWRPDTGTIEGVERVPMVWGRWRPAHPQYEFAHAVQVLPSTYDGWLLVMNEPDDAGQANMTPAQGVALWMDCCAAWPDAKLVGPHLLTALDGHAYFARAQAWFTAFWEALPAEGRQRVSAHAYHVYLNDPTAHQIHAAAWMDWCDGLTGAGRPYWVTEWGINADAHPADGGEAAVRAVAQWYDGQARVARHAYFIPWIAPEDGWAGFRLYGDDGHPTAVGRGWLG